MSYIIGHKCISCIDGACLTVCPVDCINGPIHPDNMGKESIGLSQEEKIGKQLYINPDICIDCGACLPECPVDAIYPTEEWAIKENDLKSVHANYNFHGQTYKEK
jgi:NAD-dependent dihydropyrimidine dehydrogenase PreA subunit